jgi:hypothetical protein
MALLTLGLVTAAAPATAQDATRAQALFDEGRRLMAAGSYAEACPKLAASEKLDPGAGTLMNLATCYDKNGQAASAWATFKEAASAAHAAGHADWETAARARAAELEPELPRLKIVVTRDARTPGLVLERDGETLDPAEWETALPVDAGKHIVRASAPGHATWTGEVTAPGPRTLAEITVPGLVPSSLAAPEPTTTTPTPASPPPEPDRDTGGSGQRVVGLVLGGAGVVALGVGAFFGLKAKSTHDDALTHCNASHQCDAEGLSRNDDAHSQATVATIAFVAAGALLAGGAAVFFTAPRTRTAARLRLLLGGAF